MPPRRPRIRCVSPRLPLLAVRRFGRTGGTYTLSVIDAIQGEGLTWHQVLIVFNQGFAPHSSVSEDQILAAAAGAYPEITLVSTDEVYRCSIAGSK